MHTLGHPTVNGHGDTDAMAVHEPMAEAAAAAQAMVPVVSLDMPRAGLLLNPLEVCLARLRRGMAETYPRVAFALAGRGLTRTTHGRASVRRCGRCGGDSSTPAGQASLWRQPNPRVRVTTIR